MGNIFSSLVSVCSVCRRWPPMKVIIIGPTDAGKTTLLYRMVSGELKSTVSTNGYNIETIESSYKNRRVDINVWDFGSKEAVRPLIPHCLADTSALVFVLDRTNFKSMLEIDAFLRYILDPKVASKPLLILLNKHDLEEEKVITEAAIREMTAVKKMEEQRVIGILSTSVVTGEGLHEAMEWLAEAVYGTSEETKGTEVATKLGTELRLSMTIGKQEVSLDDESPGDREKT